ncbi:MAG TPA: cell surface protein SprA [Gemmatimonadales bacterium]
MQANRPHLRFAARLALVLAMALVGRSIPARAQGTDHVVPSDSAGFLNQSQFAQYLKSIPGLAPSLLRGPWGATPGRRLEPQVVSAFDSALGSQGTAIELEAEHQRMLRRLLTHSLAVDSGSASRHGLFGLSPNTADVIFDGTWEAQLSSTRQRNLACTPAEAAQLSAGCFGGFGAPKIDNSVQLQSSGVFAQRFHININFDSKNDYAAGNIISGYYQGLEDEKLQRVNIGTVQFIPPPSRFLSASIPSNNFGISALAVFGPVSVQAIAATQKGSVVANKTYIVGSSTVEPQDVLVRDLDYEEARIFWVVDPRTLPGYPSVDVLNAGRITVPASQQPSEVRVYRYVAANQTAGASSNYDGVTATGVNGSERVGPLRWRLLKPNVDYWIDPSGLWFVLSSRIDPNDNLAVSYRTKDQTLVGSLPVTDNPAARDSIRLIYLPNRTPASPVFPYEMRQAYRVAGTSLVRSSLAASILVANSERPANSPGTYLSLLGLAVPADPATLDVDNRLFPRVRDAGASQVIKDALLIFPSAQPFSATGLSTAERNDSLYATPEYLLLSQGPPSKFQLHLQYNAAGGAGNTISLDAVQITEGSERLTVNGQPLVRDVDYTIDYATGRVSFLNPTALYGSGTATVNASFEERGLFAVAPTSIAGLTATWNLGLRKTISFAGLYQAEATGYTRPQIGYEPRASLLLGLTTDLGWDTPAISRLFNHLVSKPSTAPSSIEVSGELAVSRPDPNRSGDAYLEEFEDNNNLRIQASQNTWVLGSLPQSNAGVESIIPQGFDSASAVQLILQNLVPNSHDSITQLTPNDIDPTVALTQSTVPTIEPVLWTTLHGDTAGGLVDFQSRSHWSQPSRPGQPRFRSMMTALSATGTDLSRNDYFEFALYQKSDRPIDAAQMKIVIDLGRVSEDELSIAPTTFHVLAAGDALPHGFSVGDTIYTGRQYVGAGRLDTEKSSFGTWSATTDDNGILADRPDSLIGPGGTALHFPSLCEDSLSASILFFPWGDLGARCSRHNGVPDTEDLDGDNVLDAQGSADNVFRYVVDLHADSVRSHVVVDPSTGASATWTIYRVPLHNATDTIGSPDIHLIKQMRMTFVAPGTTAATEAPIRFALALMQFTGAAWSARADRPIASLSGPTAQFNGSVLVGSVSTQDSATSGLGYTSPPGIGDAAATVAVTQTQFSQQINETSLRIQATDLHFGQRAEGYTRLASGTRNLLAYRELRVWMHGHGPGWDNGQLQAYVKVGSDAYNFYLYKAPAHTTTWDPEMLIDMQQWQDLRDQIENTRLRGAPPNPAEALACGGDSTAYVACNGNYMVQVRDPQVNPPNLAAVQELAAGLYYPGSSGMPIAQTELWVDDIRVSQPVSTTGVAGAFTGHITASDVATFDVSGVYQNGQFHLMGQDPTYQNTSSLATNATVHLEKFLSPRLWLRIPFTLSSSWGWVAPQLISGTDVNASGIDGLRLPRNDATVWSLSINNVAHLGEATLTRLVFNPLSFNFNGSGGTNITSLSDVTSSAWSATLGYFLNNPRHTYGLHLKGITRGLPHWLRESAAGQGISNASFAPWPTAVQFQSSLSHSMGDIASFSVPITTLADTILKPVTSEQFLWRNLAGLNWDPLGVLHFTSSWSSTRDLREYDDSTTLGRVVNASHQALLGTDVGVERDRDMTNTFGFAPRISSWLAPQVTVGTNFILSRSLTTRNPVQIIGDTAGNYILPQTLDNSRATEFRVTIDPRILAQRLFGDSSAITHATVRFRPIEFSRRSTISSTFDLATFSPDLSYQLGLGSFNSFLNHQGQQAIGAAKGTTTNVTASIDLPAGFSAQIAYSSSSNDQFQQQSGGGFLNTTGTTQTWPQGHFNWSRVFASGPIVQLAAGSQVERDHSTSLSPFQDGTVSASTSSTSRVTPNFVIAFRNNVQFTANGETDRSSTVSDGNVTQTNALMLNGTLSWSTRLPRFISTTRRSITFNVTVSQNNNSSCIQRTSDSSCVPYYDLQRTELQSGFSAQLQHAIRTGFQFSYVLNNVLSLGQPTQTITLNVFFSVPLSSLGM